MEKFRPTKRDKKTGQILEGHEIGECPTCNGSGDHPEGTKDRTGDIMRCPQCDGPGVLYKWLPQATPPKK